MQKANSVKCDFPETTTEAEIPSTLVATENLNSGGYGCFPLLCLGFFEV